MKSPDDFLLQMIGDYDICGKNLGKGAFARVELANHRLTNTKVRSVSLKMSLLMHHNKDFFTFIFMYQSIFVTNSLIMESSPLN